MIDRGVRISRLDSDAPRQLRLKIYRRGGLIPLSEAVPVLENFGFRVLEEMPDRARAAAVGYIHDFSVEIGAEADIDAILGARPRRSSARSPTSCAATAEDDEFNQLVLYAGLDTQAGGLAPRLVPLSAPDGKQLRAGDRRRCAAPRSERDARARSACSSPRTIPPASSREQQVEKCSRASSIASLAKVRSIDDDRILRRLRALVEAIVRTNAFAPAAAGSARIQDQFLAGSGASGAGAVARNLGLQPARRGHSPARRAGRPRRHPLVGPARRFPHRNPRPDEGAAGQERGDRPDRRQGRLLSQAAAADVSNRDAWLAEGTESYRIFIRSLLSVTDNLVNDKVVHPDKVVIHDGDDPYFVVAADKGTATFSDIANAIALERNFWLGDAFASGGSHGYDHKAMGITAKGAWISVQRHFLEMGIDVQSDPVTVAGCGDMSGDVFGNGMLLSKTIRLVAAFDHRHIFIDPDPDPATSWAERKRLFELPRSSWDDYDRRSCPRAAASIPRTEKSIELSAEAREALGIEAKTVDPATLINAILKSPVDLLWFGGIGTYIKASEPEPGRRRRSGQRCAARRRQRAPRQGHRRGRQPRHHPGRADRVRRARRAHQHRLHRQ